MCSTWTSLSWNGYRLFVIISSMFRFVVFPSAFCNINVIVLLDTHTDVAVHASDDCKIVVYMSE